MAAARHPLGRYVALCIGAHGGGRPGQWTASYRWSLGDFSNPGGYRAAARRAAILGCRGKWAIHPSQAALANKVMSSSQTEVERAERILKAMAEAEADGKGAVSLDGRLIDYASIRQAEVLIQKVQQIAAA
jgi:malyl-CoA/(S)-citramalyl-CoA lyase